MRRVVALLAAVALIALAGCGGDGAEPGASHEATLVLDFTPNAVHAPIYLALRRGYFKDAGIDLKVREPSASSDAPKLLEAGRADFAVMDINDVALASEKGADLRIVVPLVYRPLASVIAGDRSAIRRPRDLEGKTVGVTGLPSDDAVLDSVVSADGGDPGNVNRVTIGFNAVASLAAGKVDAATAFWNAEGIALKGRGVPTREFRVDRFGAPRYPELVIVSRTNGGGAASSALQRGERAVAADPAAGVDALAAAVPDIDRTEAMKEETALEKAGAIYRPGTGWRDDLNRYAAWAKRFGLTRTNIPLAPKEISDAS